MVAFDIGGQKRLKCGLRSLKENGNKILNYSTMNYAGFKHLNCAELAAGSFCTQFYESIENSSDLMTAEGGFS